MWGVLSGGALARLEGVLADTLAAVKGLPQHATHDTSRALRYQYEVPSVHAMITKARLRWFG
eukprot:6754384-Alexandrium_andersonii.AAC.1